MKENFEHEDASSNHRGDDTNANNDASANLGSPPTDVITQDQITKAMHDAQKKEDDDFHKLELSFITELGLQANDLPSFMKDSHLESVEKK